MPKIALLTIYTDEFQPLANIVLPNMMDYCSKHNYTLYAFNVNSIESGYKKIEKILSVIEEVDAMLCLDLDTFITNHNITVGSFLDDEHDFYICKDVNGINAGSFIVKNTAWARKFLRLIHDHRVVYENEQNAIEYLIIKEDKVKILPHPSINSYIYELYKPGWGVIGDRIISKPSHEEGDWRNSDFILHLPGMTLDKRVEILNRLTNKIIL
jgi:hypothetical protein